MFVNGYYINPMKIMPNTILLCELMNVDLFKYYHNLIRYLTTFSYTYNIYG